MIKKLSVRVMFAVLIMSFAAVFIPVTAVADDENVHYVEDYTIRSAEFITEMTPEGDLVVNEKWVLQFNESGFSKFYKGIYLNVDEDEKFDSIDVKSAKINGKNVNILKYDLDGFSFNSCAVVKSKDGSSENIFWIYEPEAGETVTYQVKYVLNSVVRRSGRNNVYYTYRFVGKNFSKPIGNLSIEAKTIGSKDKIKCIYTTNESSDEQSGNKFFRSDSSGLVKCTFVFEDKKNDSYFTSEIKKGDIFHSLPFSKNTAFVGGIITFFIAAFVLIAKFGKNSSGSGYSCGGSGCGSSCGGSGCGSSCGGGGCGGGGAS